MTPIGLIGIPVALLGAFLLSLGSSVQQRGVADVGDRKDGKGGLAIKQMLTLARNRQWLLGTVMVILAIVCQLTALGLSPIAVVQPIGVFALVITALITKRSTHQKMGGPSVSAITICVTAVAIFVTVAAFTTHVSATRNSNVIAVLVIVVVVVAALMGTFFLLRKPAYPDLLCDRLRHAVRLCRHVGEGHHRA